MGPRDMGPRDMGPRDMGPRGQFQEPMRGPRPEVRDPRTVMGESRNMAPRVSQQGAGLRLPVCHSKLLRLAFLLPLCQFDYVLCDLYKSELCETADGSSVF